MGPKAGEQADSCWLEWGGRLGHGTGDRRGTCRPSGTSCCRGASVKMLLVEQSQDSLVPQLQANLTRWPQLPRKARVLTSCPVGRAPLHGGGEGTI